MSKSKNLWGGRFKGEADKGFAEFNRSFQFDRRLLEVDVRGSIAYCNALKTAAVLSDDEARKITAALYEILEQDDGQFTNFADVEFEDVHSFVEACLVDLIGDDGLKLHTGRSRNDQVATDLRLWLREAIDDLNRPWARWGTGFLGRLGRSPQGEHRIGRDSYCLPRAVTWA